MTIKLGDYCDVIKGTTGIKKAVPGDFPLVVTAEERLSHKEYQFDNKAIIIPLVSSTGHGHASIKRIHYQEGKFALGTILCAVIIKDTTIINPRFLYIYLSYFKDHLLVPLMKGAANVTLSIKRIKEVKITLPSLERQLEIIELEKNNHSIEELNDEIRIQKNLLDQLKKAILQEAIQGKLTNEWRTQNPALTTGENSAAALLKRISEEKAQLVKEKKIKREKPLPPVRKDEIPFELPEGWVWCRLLDLCSKTGSGSTPKGGKSAYKESGIKFIRSQNVYDEGLRTKDIAFVTEEVHEKMRGTKVESEDLLLNITGGSIGRCCIVPDDFDTGNINQHVAIIRGIRTESNYYLHKVICSEYFQQVIIEVQTGAGREGLPKNKMDCIIIPFPSSKEQKIIVEKVEALMEKCNVLEQEITRSEKHAQMLMQAVLKEAFEYKKYKLEEV